MASRLVFRVPGSAGTAGLEPSMDSGSAMELARDTPDFFFFCRAFWMDAVSDGRLASWWKTFRFLMMAYTRLELPERERQRLQAGTEVCVFMCIYTSRPCSHRRTDTG